MIGPVPLLSPTVLLYVECSLTWGLVKAGRRYLYEQLSSAIARRVPITLLAAKLCDILVNVPEKPPRGLGIFLSVCVLVVAFGLDY